MPPAVDAFQAVNYACIPMLENLLREISPRVESSGDHYLIISPFRDDHSLGSFKVNKKDGSWRDFATDEYGGDFISLWAGARQIGNGKAKDELANRVGLSEMIGAPGKRGNRGTALVPVPEDAPLPNWKKLGNPRRWAYRDAEGRLIRYHLRWDNPNGKKYAPLTYRCLSPGRCEWVQEGLSGGPQPLYGLDRLASHPEAPVIVVEGEKAADAAQARFPGYVCITSGSASSSRKADLNPLQGRNIVIWPDNDEPGMRYAEGMAQLLRSLAQTVRVVTPPDGLPVGWDLADEVPETMDAWDLESSIIEAIEPMQPMMVDTSESHDDLPVIQVRPPEHVVATKAQQALARLGRVYQRRGNLVHVFRVENETTEARHLPQGTPTIRNCTTGWIREQLSRAAIFQRAGKDGVTHQALVPEWLPGIIRESSNHQGIPELLAVVEMPVFLEDGSILTTPGLHAASGIFYAPLHPSLPPIPESPTLQDAEKARDFLFNLVQDFPWASQPSPATHRAAWLAFLLTTFARYAIQGPVPFVFIGANGQAAGKGLLAHCTSRIALGRELPTSTAPKDGEELKKMALPIVLEGTRIQFLDEVGSFFGSREFNGIVTGTVLKDRVLGSSVTQEAPMTTIWVTAGNNVALGSDTARRCLSIRLEPMCEHPEDRDSFAISDLMAYVREQQVELAQAALIILRAFHVAGRPTSGLKPWGSFEAWARLVRDCVYWVTGGVDCDTRPALADFADTDRIALAQLVAGLQSAFPNDPFTADQVMQLVEKRDPADIRDPNQGLQHSGLIDALETLNSNPKGLNTRTIGRILSRAMRTVVSNHYIDKAPGTSHGSALWRVREVKEMAA